MTLAAAPLNVHDGYTQALRVAGSLAFGAAALITVAVIVVVATFRWAAGPGGPRLRHPRRGTSALLLGAIAAVLLVASSEHRISSLTIVSHAGTRSMTRVQRVQGPPRKASIQGCQRSNEAVTRRLCARFALGPEGQATCVDDR